MSQVTLAIYKTDTGDILRKVSCSIDDAASQLRDGEAFVYVARGVIFDDVSHKIDLSGPVLIPLD